ncbi:glycosyltransferase [Fodinicurvata halophila]|uniref:Glycosyltransferase n=1 Tax=Fodinicurvata halophila TaxID=1419723 RepID=A0ABV8UNP8_9PROT
MLRKPRRLQKKLSKTLARTATALAPWYKRHVPAGIRKVIPKHHRRALKQWFRSGGSRRLNALPHPEIWIDYSDWITRNDRLKKRDVALIREHIRAFRVRPRFSILMPVYDSDPTYLRAALESVIDQLYPGWELVAVDDASPDARPRQILSEFAQRDDRIKPQFRSHNGGIAACSNTALEAATGDWIVLMHHDDLLAPHALYMVVEAINRHPDTAIIYSDEDHVDAEGIRSNPYFKPDWDYDLFLGQYYLNHLVAYPRPLVRQAGGFREGFEGSQDWDLALRVLEAAGPQPEVQHIPFVLYHQRQEEQGFSYSVIEGACTAAQTAVNEHLVRTGQPAKAVASGHSSHLRIRWDLPDPPPLVSIVIPTKDRCELLRLCTEGLLTRTTYAPLEIVIVDNGSSEPDALALLRELDAHRHVTVLEAPGPFNFSYLVNHGVAASTGEVCVLLNNDIDVINPDWLQELTAQVLRPEVGAVGAKLYYANDTLQHGGVILGIGGVAGHAHRFIHHEHPGYFNRLNLVHSLSCVTGACLAVRRAVYTEVGGLDETNLKVAYNDVDLCIRLGQAGYRIIWTPHARLYHYESVSRGEDTTPEKRERYRNEVQYMKSRWVSVLPNDAYYNPNLTMDREDFSLAPVPRLQRPWVNWKS